MVLAFVFQATSDRLNFKVILDLLVQVVAVPLDASQPQLKQDYSRAFMRLARDKIRALCPTEDTEIGVDGAPIKPVDLPTAVRFTPVAASLPFALPVALPKSDRALRNANGTPYCALSHFSLNKISFTKSILRQVTFFFASSQLCFIQR